MLDIRGNIVNIGDKVLVSEGRELRLGVFEKVSKVSFIIRIGVGGYAYSIKRKKTVSNPLFIYTDWMKNRKGYNIPQTIDYVDDAYNKEILKVEDDFTL